MHKCESDSIDYQQVNTKQVVHIVVSFREGWIVKKWIGLIFALFILCGCAAEQTLETISDEWDVSVMGQPREIKVSIPGESLGSTLENESGRIYLSDDYEITVETFPAGDLDATFRSVSGRGREELTVVETKDDGVNRYDFVWATAGETGERLGRGILLDDGSYYYVLTVLRDADPEKTSQIVWSEVFQSFTLL